MSNLSIRKAVKPLALLLIISAIFCPIYSISQTDTSKLKKEIAVLLKKYGLKNASFLLKVESLNQKGGQTAFEINNYNGKEIHVVNGPNYGVNGNISLGVPPRIVTKQDFTQLFSLFPNKQTLIEFQFIGLSPTSEMENLKKQIIKILIDNGYSNVDVRAGFALQNAPPPQNMWIEKKGNGVLFCIAPQ